MATKTVTTQDAPAAGERNSLREGCAGLVLLYAPDSSVIPTVVILGGTLVVGRDEVPTGLCVPQQAVSRVHARFSLHNGTWVVTDLSSRNGTFVNGQRTDRAPLAHRDQVRIGDAIFEFVDDDVDAHLPYDAAHAGGGATPELLGGLQLRRALAALPRVAPTNLNVLVLGETGTGKELVARAVHRASGRQGRLCALNCAAVPSGLIESELFGVRRGAFTGATQDRPGVVRAAHAGTLVLDEIGDMPADMQAKLLRVIETREVTPLGAHEPEKIDVRIVCLTHRDLRQLAATGVFRGDLFARINGCILELPPLRHRKEDVIVLARHFAAAAGRPNPPMTFRFAETLLAYDWPFNVRELEAAMRHAVALAGGAELDTDHLPQAVRGNPRYGDAVGARTARPSAAPPARASSESPTADALRALLAKHRGNIAAVARELGKDRAQISRWLRYASIDPTRFR